MCRKTPELDGVAGSPKMPNGLSQWQQLILSTTNLNYNQKATTVKTHFVAQGFHSFPYIEGWYINVLITCQTTDSHRKIIVLLPKKYTTVLPAALKTLVFTVLLYLPVILPNLSI